VVHGSLWSWGIRGDASDHVVNPAGYPRSPASGSDAHVHSDLLFMHNECMSVMNSRTLLERAVEVLAGFGLHTVRRPGGVLGVSVGVIRGAGDLEGGQVYRVEERSRLTGPAAAALEAQPQIPVLVVAPFVPDPAAEILRERGLDYVDLAGNALLRWDGVLIDVRGRRPARTSGQVPGPSARRPFTRSGVQVTFALLAWPDMSAASVREIANASGSAVGTVHAVLKDLRAGGYLADVPSGRRLVRGGELLTRWTEAYALSLAVTLELGRYRAPDPAWWLTAGAEMAGAGVDLGGEAAASVLDERLRPGSVSLYASEVPVRLLASYRCRRVEDPRDANVVVRRRFWVAPDAGREADLDVRDGAQAGSAGLVPPVLVYADLLASGDPRQREHAQRLRRGDARLERLDRS